ncbi:MAG TPA: site-specific integrase [Reyranella sp.]|nr:site-specific integrase [Reyranella sp.]
MKTTTLPKYVHETKTRHGKTIYHYWPNRSLPRVRLRSEPGTDDFLREYLAAKNGTPAPATIAAKSAPAVIKADTLRWLTVRYYGSLEFRSLDKTTAKQRRSRLDAICQSIHPETKLPRGDLAYAKMGRANVTMIRDTISDRPTAQNAHVKALRVLFNWAIVEGLATSNPVFKIEMVPPRTEGGHHTWSIEEGQAFERAYPVGTMARLAYTLIAYTGLRVSDAARVGPQHVTTGVGDDGQPVKVLKLVEYKGGHSKAIGKRRPQPKDRAIVLAPELLAVIDATPLCGHRSFLVNAKGNPFPHKSLSESFIRWCINAGIPECTAHGIRKASATEIADNGGTAHQIRSFGGWTSLQEVDGYTRRVNDAKLTGAAVSILSRRSRNG